MAAIDEVRVLVCDDRMHIRKILKAVLGAMGIHNIAEADDGRTAVTLLEETRASAGIKKNPRSAKLVNPPFDLLIVDWNMPNMNGIELLEFIRADRIFRKMPVLMVTAESDREHVKTAMEKGANDFIVKPFTSEVIDAKVRALLSLG